MEERQPTRQRGRIHVTGFDAAKVRDRDAADWASSSASKSRWDLAWARFKRNRTALVGLAIIAIMALVALLAQPLTIAGVTVQPLAITPHSPFNSHFAAINQPPSGTYYFGTNWQGRDIFSEVLYGGRYSLSIGAIIVALALLIGIPMGAIAGYFGGWVDEIIMRIVDILYAFPFLVLAIGIIAIFGTGYWKMVLALVIVSWIGYTRILRAEILSVKENEYVLAAKALGASDRSIIFRHIVPNAIAPVIIQATLQIGTAVLSAAALSFLGLGLQPGTPEWGTMLSRGRDSLSQGHWWITVFPGLAIFFFVLSINLVGDGVRDALDPQGDLGGGRER